MLCRGTTGDILAEALSQDHTAALEEERARITRRGGMVSWQHSSWRIGGCGIQVRSGETLALLRPEPRTNTPDYLNK